MIVKTKTCSKCGIEKSLDEFYKEKTGRDGRYSHCKKCKIKHRKEHYQEHREESNEQSRKYKKEHKDEIRQKRGCKSMYDNKLCASYLGIVIGERLCRHLFKDVEVMPYGNPGFDIVCNKGKKIDVKTGCIQLNNGKHPRWEFRIEENKIADYFICVAFDNRTDLNPLHMWMIPGKEVNHYKGGITISFSTIRKWSQWERDINDAQLCCTEIKSQS